MRDVIVTKRIYHNIPNFAQVLQNGVFIVIRIFMSMHLCLTKIWLPKVGDVFFGPPDIALFLPQRKLKALYNSLLPRQALSFRIPSQPPGRHTGGAHVKRSTPTL